MYDSLLSFLAIIDGGTISWTDYNDEVDDMFIEGIPIDDRKLLWIAQKCRTMLDWVKWDSLKHMSFLILYLFCVYIFPYT
jgi:hypothetical protein